MAIATFSEVAEIGVGGSSRLAEPVAIFSGEADVTGDATAGNLAHTFTIRAGNERRYVYLIDYASFHTNLTTAGAKNLRIFQHHELANIALDGRRVAAWETFQSGLGFQHEEQGLWDFLHAFPIWWKRDFGGTDLERALLETRVEANVDTSINTFRIAGRVFDARILASPDFWHLFPGGLPRR